MNKEQNGNELYPVLAAGIITAVRDENWEEMLKVFPEGVEHRTWKYDCPETFTEWETYEEYSRYVAPAREMIKEKCLNKALEYLNACVNARIKRQL